MRYRFLGAPGLALAALLLAGAAKNDTVTVRAVSAKLMPRPQYLGTAVATVVRGDRLSVVAKADARGWWQVTANGKTGYIHAQFVTSGELDGPVKLSAAATSSRGGANSSEVELAGRGFTREIEGEYRKSHPDLCFPQVDKIEAAKVDDGALARFAEEGQLGGKGGAQ